MKSNNMVSPGKTGRGIKKLISLVLALAMVLAIMPYAFAKGEADVAVFINVGSGRALSIFGNWEWSKWGSWTCGIATSDVADEYTLRQQWQLYYAGDDTRNGYNIQAMDSYDCFVEIANGSIDIGATANTWNGDGQMKQKWSFVPYEYNGKTVYALVNRAGGLALADKGADVNAAQEAFTGDPSQLWEIKFVTENNTLALPQTAAAELGKTNTKDIESVVDTAPGSYDNGAANGDQPIANYFSPVWSWNGGAGTAFNSNRNGVTVCDDAPTDWNHGVNVKFYDNGQDNRINVLQFWAQKKNTITPFWAEKPATDENKKGFYIYEFYPSYGSDGGFESGEMAFYDDSHNFVAAYKWDSTNTITPQGAEDAGKFADKKPVTVTGDGSANTGNRVSRVRLYITNDEKNNQHTVEWYVEGNGSWTLFATQVYSGLAFGMGRMEVYRTVTDGSYQHFGLGNLKVFAGDLVSDAEAYNAGELGTVRANEIISKEKINVDGTDMYVRWNDADTSKEGSVPVNGVIITTGQAVKGTVTVAESAAPIHSYNFDKDYSDSVNGANLNTGKSTNCSLVDGSMFLNNGYIQFPDNVIKGYDEMTLSTFVKLLKNDKNTHVFDFGTQAHGIFMNVSNGTNSNVNIRDNVTDKVEFWTEATTPDLTLNQWHNVTVTVKDGTVKYYVDGELTGENSNEGLHLQNVLTEEGTCFIGRSHWPNYDPNLTGYVDDFKIYNLALTEGEVSALANAGRSEYTVTAETALTAANVAAEGVAAADDLGIGVTVKTDKAPEGINGYGYKLAYGDGVNFTDFSEKEAAEAFSAVFTNNSNVIWKITPFVKYGGNKVYGEKSTLTSLYEEVVSDLANAGNNYNVTGNLNDARLAKANKVIADGGVILTEGKLDATREKILAIETVENGVKITSKLAGSKVGFLCDNNTIYVGSGETALTVGGADTMAVYTTLTINTADNTATLSGLIEGTQVNLNEAVTFSLEAVEIEFVDPEVFEQNVDSEVSMDFGFVDVM